MISKISFFKSIILSLNLNFCYSMDEKGAFAKKDKKSVKFLKFKSYSAQSPNTAT